MQSLSQARTRYIRAGMALGVERTVSVLQLIWGAGCYPESALQYAEAAEALEWDFRARLIEETPIPEAVSRRAGAHEAMSVVIERTPQPEDDSGAWLESPPAPIQWHHHAPAECRRAVRGKSALWAPSATRRAAETSAERRRPPSPPSAPTQPWDRQEEAVTARLRGAPQRHARRDLTDVPPDRAVCETHITRTPITAIGRWR